MKEWILLFSLISAGDSLHRPNIVNSNILGGRGTVIGWRGDTTNVYIIKSDTAHFLWINGFEYKIELPKTNPQSIPSTINQKTDEENH